MSTESSPEPTREAAFFTTIRSWGIVRGDNRVFGGVLSGVGARIGMAPAPARIIFVLIALVTSGLGTLAYAAAWALLPDSEGRIIIQDFGRGRPNVGAIVAIAILTLVGFAGMGQFGIGNAVSWGDDTGGGWFSHVGFGAMSGMVRGLFVLFAVLIPIAIVAGAIALIVWAVRSSKRANPAAQGFARMPDGTVPDGTVADAPAPDAPVAAAPAAETADAGEALSTAQLIALGTPPLASFAAPTAPPVYTAPPKPPRPRIPGPGKFGYLAALALIPIAAAITLYLFSINRLAVYPALAAAAMWVAGLGLILIITALRGRKLGFLGFLSVIALIPMGLSIAYADDIHDAYVNVSGHWWNWDQNSDVSMSYSPSPDPDYTEPPTFDPASAFSDYSTVAIAGQCSSSDSSAAADATGNISLADVTGPTTLTIATNITRVVIPRGTNLAIIAPSNTDAMPYVNVTWVDRDVSCGMTSGVTDLVTLSNPDAPLLSLELAGNGNGDEFDIYIEEN